MKKLNKIFCSAAIVCGVFSTMTMSVSAAGNEVRVPEVTTTVVAREETSLTEEVPSDIIPSVTEETTYPTSEPTVSEAEETEESTETENGVILPDGNATLGEDVNNGVVDRQFIAVQTKNGNTFYLIIDKNAEGEENVYFLNMVDEYDLMAFADDIPENVQAAMDEANGEVEVPTDENGNPIEEQPTDENGEPVEDTTKTEQSGDNNTGLIILGVVALAGGGVFCYMKFFKNKSATPKKPVFSEEEYEDEYEDEQTINEDEAADEDTEE